MRVDFKGKVYRFYETELRIMAADAVYMIPVIAYPIINLTDEPLFPSFIDFQIKTIGNVHVITKDINCSIA